MLDYAIASHVAISWVTGIPVGNTLPILSDHCLPTLILDLPSPLATLVSALPTLYTRWEVGAVRFHLTLNFILQLIKPELLFYTKITPKFVLQSCPPSAANTTLGICYTCVALCCSPHGCCAVECGAACCAAHNTAIATLTLPCTRLFAHQSTQQL